MNSSTLTFRSAIVVAFIFTLVATTTGEVFAQSARNYYATVDPSSPATLRRTLHEVIDDHRRFPYSSSAVDTWDILESADQDPVNSANVLDVYRNASYLKVGRGNNNYNRELSWPKSFGFPNDGSSNYAYTDCHHLFICNSRANSTRSNKPYANCDASATELETEENNGQGGGEPGTYPGSSNWTRGSNDQGSWETWIGRRGDVARALFYMDVRYEGGSHGTTGHSEPDLILTNNRAFIAASKTGNNESVAYMGLLSDLLRWHCEDPVDAKERARNEAVFGHQGNRNPFIDHPEWVHILFGSQCPDGPTHPSGPSPVGNVFISEIHYGNAGPDVGEFIEVAGPGGADLNGWRLVLYNGRTGFAYRELALMGVIPGDGEVGGAIAFDLPLQNGSPDGIALLNANDQVVEFLSYEGVMTARDGQADGHTSTDLGVSESGSTPTGQSLQRSFQGGAWTGPVDETRGTLLR